MNKLNLSDYALTEADDYDRILQRIAEEHDIDIAYRLACTDAMKERKEKDIIKNAILQYPQFNLDFPESMSDIEKTYIKTFRSYFMYMLSYNARLNGVRFNNYYYYAMINIVLGGIDAETINRYHLCIFDSLVNVYSDLSQQDKNSLLEDNVTPSDIQYYRNMANPMSVEDEKLLYKVMSGELSYLVDSKKRVVTEEDVINFKTNASVIISASLARFFYVLSLEDFNRVTKYIKAFLKEEHDIDTDDCDYSVYVLVLSFYYKKDPTIQSKDRSDWLMSAMKKHGVEHTH